MSTYFPSGQGLAEKRKWYVVDAAGQTVGRLADDTGHYNGRSERTKAGDAEVEAYYHGHHEPACDRQAVSAFLIR